MEILIRNLLVRGVLVGSRAQFKDMVSFLTRDLQRFTTDGPRIEILRLIRASL